MQTILFHITKFMQNFLFLGELKQPTTQTDKIDASAIEQYNKIAKPIFTLVLPIITALAGAFIVFNAIKVGIAMSNSKDAGERSELKKKLMYILIGLGLTILAPIVLPLLTQLFAGISFTGQ